MKLLASEYSYKPSSSGGLIFSIESGYACRWMWNRNIFELDGARPVMRTYTIRHFDPEQKRLSVDFVMHEHDGVQGIASRWAANAVKGDRIMIAGPGSIKPMNTSADWFFLAGDMTALPAISCNLERLPAHAQGYVVIEIAEHADRQELVKPEGMQIEWIVKSEQSLPEKVESMLWLAGTPEVWAACEFSTMRQLRQYFKVDRQLERDNLYISSYWKINRSEEEHKVDKRKDAEQEAIS